MSSPDQWFKNNLNTPLVPNKVIFSAFGGGKLKCLGVSDAKLACNNMEIVKPVFLIDLEGPPLLGGSALANLNFVKIHAVRKGSAQ